MTSVRVKRTIAGGAVLALAAVAAWVAVVPGASADETSVPSVMTPYYSASSVGRQPAVADQSQWYVAVADRGLLKVLDQKGTYLGEETPGTRWVAVNHGAAGRPLQTYQLEVSYPSGSALGDYGLQWINANWLLNRPSETTSIGEERVEWGVAARKINLTAGDKVRMKVQGNGISSVAFLYGKPNNPASAVRNWKSADLSFTVDKLTEWDQFTTYDFVAPATAEYLVVFNQGWTTKEKPTVITTVN